MPKDSFNNITKSHNGAVGARDTVTKSLWKSRSVSKLVARRHFPFFIQFDELFVRSALESNRNPSLTSIA